MGIVEKTKIEEQVERFIKILRSMIPEEIQKLPENSKERINALIKYFPEWLKQLHDINPEDAAFFDDFIARIAIAKRQNQEDEFITDIMKQVNIEKFGSFSHRFGVTSHQGELLRRQDEANPVDILEAGGLPKKLKPKKRKRDLHSF